MAALLAVGYGGPSMAASPTPAQPAQAHQSAQVQQSAGAGTLNVSPTIISLSVQPGGTASADLTLRADILETVRLEADGLGQAADGSFQFLPAEKDASSYSARTMLSVSPSGSFEMQAGSSQKITVTVRVPGNAGNGTRYAILRITGTPGTGDSNVGIGVQLGVPALINLTNTTATRSGSLDGLAISGTAGQPIIVDGAIKNTGDSHFGAAPNQVTSSATLLDGKGAAITSGRTTLDGNSVVPTFSRSFSITMPTARGLSAGRYRVEVKAILQDGTVLDQKELAFDLSAEGVLGATFVPVEGTTKGGSGGLDGSIVLLVGLGGVLMGALLVAIVTVAGRRQRRISA